MSCLEGASIPGESISDRCATCGRRARASPDIEWGVTVQSSSNTLRFGATCVLSKLEPEPSQANTAELSVQHRLVGRPFLSVARVRALGMEARQDPSSCGQYAMVKTARLSS